MSWGARGNMAKGEQQSPCAKPWRFLEAASAPGCPSWGVLPQGCLLLNPWEGEVTPNLPLLPSHGASATSWSGLQQEGRMETCP